MSATIEYLTEIKQNRVIPLQKANVSVVIPALNEAPNIRQIVKYAVSDPATAEVIVVDDGSIDDTAKLARSAGARVIISSMSGKGASMNDGTRCANKDIVVFLDAALSQFEPRGISRLTLPIVQGEADFVKARFGRGGGRVTELTAKPMLKVFFPELAHLAQPLGGIVAARKNLLTSLNFEDGHGADIGMLLDAHLSGAKLTEVDIGHLAHDSQPQTDLSLIANEVSRAILERARNMGRLHVEQVTAMFESQRQAAANIDYVLTQRRGQRCLLLLDMDGTVTPNRYVIELARHTGKLKELKPLLDTPENQSVNHSQQIAELFRSVHKHHFEHVARNLPLRAGVIEFVNQARRNGFFVGVISDSYFIAAELVRRRIFADFAIAHTLTFDGDVCNGQLQINPAFYGDNNRQRHRVCKSNVLRHFLSEQRQPPIELSWAVGDNLNDKEMLCLVDNGFVIDPKSACLLNEPGVNLIDSFWDLHKLLPKRHRQ